MEGRDYCSTAASHGSTAARRRWAVFIAEITVLYLRVPLRPITHDEAGLSILQSIIDRSPLTHNKPCKLHARMGSSALSSITITTMVTWSTARGGLPLFIQTRISVMSLSLGHRIRFLSYQVLSFCLVISLTGKLGVCPVATYCLNL